jgi:protein-disulfide isomerase
VEGAPTRVLDCTGAVTLMNKRTLDLLSVVIVVAAALLWGGAALKARLEADGDPPPRDDRLPVGLFADIASTGQRVGPEAAPVIAVVYSNYGCGFCTQLAATLVKLQARCPYNLAVVWKHFDNRSFGTRHALSAGAECAGDQDWFRQYHEAVFANSDVRSDPNAWLKIAGLAAVPDLAIFQRCVHSGRQLARIKSDWDQATRLGVTGTPTTFLNGLRVVGATPMNALDSLIAFELPKRAVSRDR